MIPEILRSIPTGKSPQLNYNNFARNAAAFLRQPGRAITISPLPFRKGRDTGNRQIYTLRFAFRADEVKVASLDRHIELGDRLFAFKIDRIVLKSGAQEKDIQSLIDLIVRPTQPTAEAVRSFNCPNINIVFMQTAVESRVLRAEKPAPAATPPIIAPPARIEVKPVSVPPTSAPTPAAQPALGTLSVEELLSRGRQLNKSVTQKGLNPALKTEIESWLSSAQTRIDSFIESGETNDFDAHFKLAKQKERFGGTRTVKYVSYSGNNCYFFIDPLSGREYILHSSLAGPFTSLPKRFPHAIEIVPLGNHDPFTALEICCTKGFLQTAETLMMFIRENRTVTVRTENVDVVYLNSPNPKIPMIIKDRNPYIISIIGNSDLGDGWRPIGKLEISLGECQDYLWRRETISFRFRPQEHHRKASNPLDFARAIASSPLELEVVSPKPAPAAVQPAAKAGTPAKPPRPLNCGTWASLSDTLARIYDFDIQREKLKESIKWQREQIIKAGGLVLKTWLEYLLEGDHLLTEYPFPEDPYLRGKIQNTFDYLNTILTRAIIS